MADPINSTQPQERQEGGFHSNRTDGSRREGNRSEGSRTEGSRGAGERSGAQREAGGFRIRLSDNELRAARAVQDAFGLRSTVAALGLSIRTVAQLLEDGQLADLVARHRAEGPAAGAGSNRPPRGERPGRPGDDRGARPVGRPNPFARPSRPAPAPSAIAEAPEEAAASTEPPTEGVFGDEPSEATPAQADPGQESAASVDSDASEG